MKTFYLFLSILLLSTVNLNSKDLNTNNLPQPLNMSNSGQEFYFSFIPGWEGTSDNEIKLFIYSNIRTLVTVEVKSHSFKESKYTVPNDMIEFVLSADIAHAYRKKEYEPPEPDNVYKSAGIHVYADAPIICYGMSKNQNSSDGFLALPVNVLGKEYIVASYEDPADNKTTWFPAYTAITAAYDMTKVTFTMGGTDWSHTAGGLRPGSLSTWNLNAGDVLLVGSLGQHSDISGSTVSATKPVSVVSGSYCAYVPQNVGTGDYMIEMEIPTHLWGTFYHIPQIASKKKNSYLRIFAKEAKTKIFRDNQQIGYLRTAGGTEGDGYLLLRADEGTVRPMTYGGDKPIGITLYNTGQQDDNTTGDPFQMVMIPVEQYSNEMIFCTPGINGGKGFQYYYITICYQATQWGTIPDDLEFGELMDSTYNWLMVKEISPNPGQPFNDTSYDKNNYYNKTLVLPNEGIYKVRAKTPLQVYVYGFSSYDAFGYPSAADLKPLPPADTLPPVPEWYMCCDGSVNVCRTKYVYDKPDDPDVRSNLATIFMDTQLSYNYKLYHSDFMPCLDSAVAWRLEIIDPNEDARAVVTFIDCAGNDTTLDIRYSAIKLSVVPKQEDFGVLSKGQTIDKKFYVVNNSETSSAKMFYLKLKKNNANFSIWDSSGTTPLPEEFPDGIEIAPLDSFPFIVRFEANKEGEFWDSIGVGDTCNFEYKSFSYALIAYPLINVSEYNFPETTMGNTSSGEFIIKNLGSLRLEIYEIKGPFLIQKTNNTKIFVSEGLIARNISSDNPLVLNPNESMVFQVEFKPDEEKFYLDSIVFISNSIKDPSLNNNYPIDSLCILSGNGKTVDVDDEILDELISITPNPANDKLIISTYKPITDLKVFDILAVEKPCNLSKSNTKIEINTRGLIDGIYFLKISVDNQIIIKKFIIQK